MLPELQTKLAGPCDCHRNVSGHVSDTLRWYFKRKQNVPITVWMFPRAVIQLVQLCSGHQCVSGASEQDLVTASTVFPWPKLAELQTKPSAWGHGHYHQFRRLTSLPNHFSDPHFFWKAPERPLRVDSRSWSQGSFFYLLAQIPVRPQNRDKFQPPDSAISAISCFPPVSTPNELSILLPHLY